MISGAVMVMVNASPGNIGAFWWVLLTIVGGVLNPLIAIPIINWVDEKHQNYNTWKKGADKQ